MRAILFAGIGAVLALLAGCSRIGMMQGQDHEGMQQSIDNARDEVTLHQGNVAAATSMDQVRDELARHARTMSAIHDDMRQRIGHMSSCGDSTFRDDMMGMMDSVIATEDEHAAAMNAAGGLDQARAECDRYAAETARVHDRMDHRCDEMSCM